MSVRPRRFAADIYAWSTAQVMATKEIGSILLDRRLITPEQLLRAKELQRKVPQSLVSILISQGYVSEDMVLKAQAAELHVRVWDVEKDKPRPNALRMIPASVCKQYSILPLQVRGDLLLVAMRNPQDTDAIEMLRNLAGMRIEPVLVGESRLEYFLSNLTDDHFGSENMEDTIARAMTEFGGRAEVRDREDLAEEDTRPVVGLVNEIMSNAIRMKASDIHVDPLMSSVELRFRLDGQLVKIREIPADLQSMLAVRFKIMAGLDIVETRLPQDGRISVTIEGRPVDLRVSTMPNIHGERIVLRVLDRQAGVRKLDDLGFSPNVMSSFRQLIRKPYGMFLVTGPTGSGKTTTLYAALQEVRTGANNVMTCEDPVEYEVPGIAQSQVNEKIGLTFASQLRSILRQDPDVILVGEIRDHETAETAIRASLTGHMVFSTLHSNDSLSAIPRLMDIGVDPYLLGSSLVGVMSQRLVRKLCVHCRESLTPSESDWEFAAHHGVDLNGAQIYRACGCDRCYGTGYSGRQAALELLPITPALAGMISEKSRMDVFESIAREQGFETLQTSAIKLWASGITSLEEVSRVVFFDDVRSTPLSRAA